MKSKNFWENFILAAIVLAIVQTFLDDLSIYMHWSVSARNNLLVSSLVFDFIFTVEFTVRSILAARKKRASGYWIYERGWADFISSIPLLLLYSGPSVILMYSDRAAIPAGVLAILNAIISFQAIRILRLVRIIKIFGKLPKTESPMSRHHTAVTASTSVSAIICALMLFSLITTTPRQMKIREVESRYQSEIKNVQALREDTRKSYKYIVTKLFKSDPAVLKIVCEDVAVMMNVDAGKFNQYYSKNDYVIISNSGITIYVSLAEINKEDAAVNLLHFFIIIVTGLAFMFIYARHFTRNISDVIDIMGQGFRKRHYDQTVNIKEEFKEHEVFTLARFYNDVYIPAKKRKLQREETEKSFKI